tara:strand:- start:558 stop:707 length:150 start_codon:yes stop_codon:yes gene_type:complete
MKKYTVKGHWSRSFFADSYLKAREYAENDLQYVNPNLNMKVKSINEEEE